MAFLVIPTTLDGSHTLQQEDKKATSKTSTLELKKKSLVCGLFQHAPVSLSSCIVAFVFLLFPPLHFCFFLPPFTQTQYLSTLTHER